MPDTGWITIRVELLQGLDIVCDPPPGRVILVGPRHTFAELGEAIDLAFARWDISHLHVFELPGGRRLGFPDPELDFEDDSAVPVTSLVGPADTFTYTYDLGDEWLHDCRVEEAAVDPEEVSDDPPERPVPVWGWGTIPDQYGRSTDDRT